MLRGAPCNGEPVTQWGPHDPWGSLGGPKTGVVFGLTKGPALQTTRAQPCGNAAGCAPPGGRTRPHLCQAQRCVPCMSGGNIRSCCATGTPAKRWSANVAQHRLMFQHLCKSALATTPLRHRVQCNKPMPQSPSRTNGRGRSCAKRAGDRVGMVVRRGQCDEVARPSRACYACRQEVRTNGSPCERSEHGASYVW